LASVSGLTFGCSGNTGPTDGDSQTAVTESSSEQLVARPSARLILTDSLVSRLQARAASGEAAWTALKAKCDGYVTGTMYAPNGNAYPDFPSVGQGYQGEDYVPAIRAIGLCYRTATDATSKANYGAAGGRLLAAMSTPVSSGGEAPSTDDGYGIRNYVVGMAFGYDWLYPALSATTKSQVISSMNAWIDWYDQSGFINNDPIGNYFAGYFLAKTAAALATNGDNPNATTYWNDVTTRMWGKLVQPEFQSRMAGGGWPEGWEYGKKAVLSFAEAILAVKTATGTDWSQQIPFAHDQAEYQMHFAWPALKHLDDQGTIHSGVVVNPSAELVLGLATMMEANGDATAPLARGFAADVVSAVGNDSAPWSAFLYGDPAKPKASYKTDSLSHLAAGPGHVGMRSTWDATATWGGLEGGAYINASDSGEELFDAGNLSVVAGDQPVLINATGWLPQNAGSSGEDMVYDDSYGTKQRRLYNSFFVNDASNPYNPGQNSADPTSSKAHVERYEEAGVFVRARAANLEGQYGNSGYHPVSQFTRDLVYVRPGTFVLFDRTTVAQASADQWLSFHTPVAPTSATTADSTQRRFDVVVKSANVGSIRTLLPRSASTSTTALLASGTRLEVHAPAHAAVQQWLSVVTTGTTGEQVRLSAADGNVASNNVVGVELDAPQNQVVLFPSDQAGTATLTNADYTVSPISANHVVVDVAASSSGYAISATPTGGKLHVVIKQGGSFKPTANGSLSFAVSASGAVSANVSSSTTAPSAPTPPTTPTPPPTVPTTPPTTPTAPPTTQTVTLAEGVNGYGGVTDASISNLYYSASDPNGTSYTTGDELYAYTLDYTTKALIKFDLSQIPATASVVSASLALTIESWVNPQTLIGNFVSKPWNDGSSSFGWSDTGTGAAWSTPGIGSADLQGPTFQITGINSSGYQRKTIALDATTVQSWVQNAAANAGLVFSNPTSGQVLRIYSSRATNVAQRPALSLTYR
jgi:hypothetical protein